MRRLTALFWVLLFFVPGFAGAAGRKPLDYAAYDGWRSIAGPVLSNDGAWLAYALLAQDGDGELVVRNVRTGDEVRRPRGRAPVFTADGRYVVYTVTPKKADVDAAHRAKKKPEDSPKDGVAILDLTTKTEIASAERVKQVALPLLRSPIVAYHLEPGPSPAPPSAGPEAGAASAPPAPSPSVSASPNAFKSKETPSPLIVRDLRTARETTYPDVTGYALSSDGAWLAFTTASRDGSKDGVFAVETATGNVRTLAKGEGRYKAIAFAREANVAAFLSDRDSYAQRAPAYVAYVWDAAHPDVAPKAVAGAGTPGMPANWGPSDNGVLRFTRDGSRLYLGTAAIPTPAPSATPEPMRVEVWNWRDSLLQSEQKVRADRERKRTYGATVDLRSGRFVQLANPQMPELATVESGRFALTISDLPYRRAASWTGDYVDADAVDLESGAHRRIVTKAREAPRLSPEGRYVLTFDEQRARWYSIRTSDLHRTELGADRNVSWTDELWDRPGKPAPYELPGVPRAPNPWFAGDRGVAIADRYDVYRADPETGATIALTGGFGRRTHRDFAYVQLDPEALAIPVEPLLFASRDERTMATGFWRVDSRGSGAPQKLIERDAQLGPFLWNGRASLPVIKAKDADVVAFTRQRFEEFPDLWVCGTNFAAPVRVSDANPQQAQYVWGRNRLIDFTNANGQRMRALLTLPGDFDPKRRYPMLVYIYERFSDYMYAYHPPGPGTSPSMSRYASNGYAILRPDIAYRVGRPGESALGNVMPAVDAALKLGFVDPKRVGIAGHSWGAYEIAYLITRTSRFRAVEAGATVGDMISAYGGIRLESGHVREFQYEAGQSRIGPPPWDRTDLYLENSALFHIRNVRTPYLTIHNDEDGAVPFVQGIEFFTALRRLGKESYMFVYNGEDHNLRGREQQKHWTVHLDEYFDHFLKGAPAPQWMRAGVDYLHRGDRNVRPLYGESEL